MNRRGFLGLLAATPIAAVLAPDLVELLAPKRTIFLPPRGGWHADMSRYFTSKHAWYLKTEPFPPPTMFWREPLTEDSLEQAIIAMVARVEAFSKEIAIRPTRLIVHPSWTREQIEERIRQL